MGNSAEAVSSAGENKVNAKEPKQDGPALVSLGRYRTVLTLASACVLPVLYLIYVSHFAVNDLQFDDWSVVPIINKVMHGGASLRQLWELHAESRVILPNLIFIVFGYVDRFDTRSVIILNAIVFIGSYAILLALFRRYIGRSLTPVPVLIIGLVWFSLADVQASLWAFQLTWYLVVLFVLGVIFALMCRRTHQTAWFAVAVIMAVAASCSFLQGFLAWPLGAVCIVWAQPRLRRTLNELITWIGSMLVTVVVYFWGYHVTSSCIGGASGSCSTSFALQHPFSAVKYLFTLIGNVIPGGGSWGNDFFPITHFARFEILGGAIFAAAGFILVQSWRHRLSSERFPLPLLLILFSLSFDLIITIGRSEQGLNEAIMGNRYVLPNLILLTAIVIYAWAHIPHHRPAHGTSLGDYLAWLGLLGLSALLLVQVPSATDFGITNGRDSALYLTEQARFAVNLDRVPTREKSCNLNFYVFVGISPSLEVGEQQINLAARSQLGEFQKSSYKHYRALGLPKLANCSGSAP